MDPIVEIKDIIESIPVDFSISTDRTLQGENITVVDQFGRKIILLSNRQVKKTFIINSNVSFGTITIRRWDEIKVTNHIVYSIFARTSLRFDKSMKLHIFKLLDDPITSNSIRSLPLIKDLRDQTHAHFQNEYKLRVNSSIERIKIELSFLKDEISETDLTCWYRETIIKDVIG